ncbi:MAG: hypothetical protein K9L28_01255 [Synergistales bacterium]|nr:hypothetical protein [Synergistales bacterium]
MYTARTRGIFLVALALFVFASGGAVSGEPRKEQLLQEVSSILERNTVFHWGDDCLVWMVHYPEHLAGPWADLEAAKRGLSPAERARYREDFVEELKIDRTEPILLTVYHFGGDPLDLNPLTDRMVLRTSGGREVPLQSYDKRFDEPLTGVTQGLVFFPEQQGSFTVELLGLGFGRPRRFAFAPTGGEGAPADMEPYTGDALVVQLPEALQGGASEGQRDAAPSEEQERRKPTPTPVPKPTATPEPAKASEPPVPTPPRWLVLPQSAGVSPTPVPEPTAPPQPVSSDQPTAAEVPEAPHPDAVLGESKEQLVRRFLELWRKKKAGAMYELLAESSREAMTAEAFAEKLEDDNFALALKNGYKLRWEQPEKVKVAAPQKLLVMRVLRSRTLTLVKESGVWRIVW